MDWLRLARTPTVGSVAFHRLLDRFKSAAAALDALPSMARGSVIPRREEILAEIDAGEALGARLIAACEPDFPVALAAIDGAPPVLWVLGRAELLSRPMVGIVGARTASAAGQRFASALAADLGAAGWVVVSGMARGIDAAAHRGALASGTVAALAGGVDQIWPPENAALQAQVAVQGALVSERAIGHVAKAKDFPRRNRLISGLAAGVVVVEAELRSGSLITARLAGEQGREVFAVPGSPIDPRSRGSNDLIRQGATLTETAEDVLRVLEPARRRANPPDPGPAEAIQVAVEAASHDALLSLLSPTPSSIDDLARASGLSPASVNAALLELSLAGRAELLPGNLAVSV